MRKLIKKILFPFLVLTILYASACNVNTADDAMDAWVQSRMQAMESGDADLYLQTVNSGNYYLYNEEFNLISSVDAKELSSLSITAKLVQDDIETAVYEISQEYEYSGDDYQCSYEAQFIKNENGLCYNGLEAHVLDSEGVTVYYPNGFGDSAGQYTSAVKYYLEKLNSVYSYTPDPEICIKIYSNHEVFLQSVKIDLPKWVGGWHEYGESIKIYAPNKNAGIHPGTVYHECSHRFLSEISNDNASYWLQEGFATLMETAIPTGLANINFLYNNDIENLNDAASLWSFDEFIEVNLEELSDTVQVMGYYALSALCAKHIIDTAGIDSFLAAVSELKANPQIRLTASEKIDTTNELTVQALCGMLKMTKDEFYNSMNEYIDTYR